MVKQKAKLSEKETEKRILMQARSFGVEDQVKKIISKYRDAIKGAKDEYQRKHIAACGLAEIHKAIGCVGPLIVDGVEVLPALTGYETEIVEQTKKIIKLD